MIDPKIFWKLHDWLENDRDRRSLVLRADSCEIWHAALYIEHTCIAGTSGGDIDETLTQVLDGMVLQPESTEGTPVKDPQKRIAVWIQVGDRKIETEIEVPEYFTDPKHIRELAEEAMFSMLQVEWKETKD